MAVEGCCHGELDAVYTSLSQLEQTNGIKVDLLICCGDFEVRFCPRFMMRSGDPVKRYFSVLHARKIGFPYIGSQNAEGLGLRGKVSRSEYRLFSLSTKCNKVHSRASWQSRLEEMPHVRDSK